jgi:membrane-associated phospholipid phosphatase
LRPIQCTIPRRSLAIVAAVCAAAFAALAIYLWESPHRTAIEGDITDAITSTTKNGAYRLFDAVGVFGSTGVVAVAAVVLAAFAWWWWRSPRLAVVCVLGPGLAGIGQIVLKEVIGRPRPSSAALSGESGFGFPSGHASGATALAVVIVLLVFAAFPPRHPLRVVVVIAAVVYALAIAAARVVVGAHLPLDVLGAALLGTVSTLVAILVLLPERATASDLARSAAPPG